jgi:hypothetical protein
VLRKYTGPIREGNQSPLNASVPISYHGALLLSRCVIYCITSYIYYVVADVNMESFPFVVSPPQFVFCPYGLIEQFLASLVSYGVRLELKRSNSLFILSWKVLLLLKERKNKLR